MGQAQNIVKTVKSDLIVLVSSPLVFKGYFTGEGMAIDDLGLGYLSAELRHRGENVVVIDSGIEQYDWDQLEKRLIELRPAFIGVSDPMINFAQSLDLMARIKKGYPETVIIYGDLHASLFCKEILEREPQVDFVIVGEGDHNFPELIHALKNGKDYFNIPGLAYRKNAQIIINQPEPVRDIDNLPFPDRPSLRQNIVQNKKRLFSISSSRGCPGRCTFCCLSTFLNSHQKYKKARWRERSAGSLFSEMKHLYNRGVRRIWFCDDNWIGDRDSGLERALDVAKQLIRNNMDLSYSALIRPDSLIPEQDDEALVLLKKSGLDMVYIGLEASQPEQLRRYGKPYNLELASRLVKMFIRHEIAISATYLMFYPYSSFESLRTNGEWLHKSGLSHLFNLFGSRMLSFSRIELERKLIKDNLVKVPTTYRDMGEYSFIDPRIESLQQALSSLFRSRFDLVALIRDAGYVASADSRKGGALYSKFTYETEPIGQATYEMFLRMLDLYESDSDPDNYTTVHKNNWLKIIDLQSKLIEPWGRLQPGKLYS